LACMCHVSPGKRKGLLFELCVCVMALWLGACTYVLHGRVELYTLQVPLQ